MKIWKTLKNILIDTEHAIISWTEFSHNCNVMDLFFPSCQIQIWTIQTKNTSNAAVFLLSNGIEQSIFNGKKMNNIGKYALATPGI